jgi:hypothetical protein
MRQSKDRRPNMINDEDVVVLTTNATGCCAAMEWIDGVPIITPSLLESILGDIRQAYGVGAPVCETEQLTEFVRYYTDRLQSPFGKTDGP